MKTQYPHAPKSRPNFCPIKMTLLWLGEDGVYVIECQLLAGYPCRWKDGTEKKEVVDNQQDIPQRDLEMKMRQKGRMPKMQSLGNHLFTKNRTTEFQQICQVSDFSKIANGTVLYNIYADLCTNYCY